MKKQNICALIVAVSCLVSQTTVFAAGRVNNLNETTKNVESLDESNLKIDFSEEELVQLLGEEATNELMNYFNDEANLYRARGGLNQTIYVSKENMESWYGREIGTGSDLLNMGIGKLVGMAVKNNPVGIAASSIVELVNLGVRGRNRQLDRIVRDILKGARGMKVDLKGNPGGYPAVSVEFSTWW